MLTNPPPSSGGILIADALGILERLDAARTARDVIAEVIASTNRARDEEFLAGLGQRGLPGALPAQGRACDRGAASRGALAARATRRTSRCMDAEGGCASVTCSNGSCSGVVVPGTGMHLNNMLGEQDLNPLGYHRHEPGARVPSMMAPTVVLRDGRPEVALGSAGSNRIRSAILQTMLGVVDHGLPAAGGGGAPAHPRRGARGRGRAGSRRGRARRGSSRAGWTVRRWAEQNLFFGGVQAVARNPETGELSGGGDPGVEGSRRLSANACGRPFTGPIGTKLSASP